MNSTPINIAFILIISSIILETLVYKSRLFWIYRRKLIAVCLLASAFGTGIVAGQNINFASLMLLFFAVYRIVNQLRHFAGKMNDNFLKNVAARSFYFIVFLQLLALSVWTIDWQNKIDIVSNNFGLIYACLSLMVSAVILISVQKNLTGSKITRQQALNLNEAPTLTVAIAARNEDKDINDCIQSVLNSNYPKLEVLVLDDSSQDNTSDIIKQFAHDGVRFIAGDELKNNWIARNQALQKLLDESVGELIVFMAADVKLEADTLAKTAAIFIKKNIGMMSVAPRIEKRGFLASIIQPVRYFTEYAMPARLLKRPPVINSFWIADRKQLVGAGGFKSVPRTIIPEEYLAKHFYKQKKYLFFRSDNILQIRSYKDFASNWTSAIINRYPQTHRKPHLVMALSVLMLFFVIVPFLALPYMLITTAFNPEAFILSISCLILILANFLISKASTKRGEIIALINLPVVAILDIVTLNVSMSRYEFSSVIWRGREVGSPLEVLPKLPDLE